MAILRVDGDIDRMLHSFIRSRRVTYDSVGTLMPIPARRRCDTPASGEGENAKDAALNAAVDTALKGAAAVRELLSQRDARDAEIATLRTQIASLQHDLAAGATLVRETRQANATLRAKLAEAEKLLMSAYKYDLEWLRQRGDEK